MTTPDGGAAGPVYLTAPAAAVRAAADPAGGLETFLSPDEQRSMLRFKHETDRLDYAASHALFRLLAARQLGLSPGAAAGLTVKRRCAGCSSSEHGKPSIAGVELSLSRSHGTVMAAAGPAGTQLGADIERIPADLFAGFDDYVLAPEERTGPGMAEPPESSPHGDVTARIALWVAKEAVLKAAGLGLALDPSTVSLVDASGAPAPVPGAHVQATGTGHPSVDGLLAAGVPAPPGYLAAVAGREGVPGQSVPLSALFS